jgi:hypothetical protein
LDYDFVSNNLNFDGIFNDEAMRRRAYPILRITNNNNELWSKFWRLIEDENFIKSYVKYMKEEFFIEYNIQNYNPSQYWEQSKLFVEIMKNKDKDNIDEWIEHIKETEEFTEINSFHYVMVKPKDDEEKQLIGYKLDDLYNNYKTYTDNNRFCKTKSQFKNIMLERYNWQQLQRIVRNTDDIEKKLQLMFFNPNTLRLIDE